MAKRLINNQRPPDGNPVRNRTYVQEALVSLIPEGFVTTPEELEILKWALQFYLYQEKNQKISGKIFINEITEAKKSVAIRLLQKLS